VSKPQQLNPGAQLEDQPRIGPVPPTAAGLDALTAAIRAAVGRRADWGETAELVAGELERQLPAVSEAGDVSGFAPPGDIHRVRNAGDRVAISIHIYGTDVSRVGSGARRDYDLPVLPARAAA
jgi:hypothetical protein